MAFHIPPGAMRGLHSPGTRGLIFGLTAAVFYGLIPTFTLPICGEMGQDNPNAMSTMSILFYRFMIASVIMAGLMLIKRRSFRISRGEIVTLMYLAFLSDGAAMFLLAGYPYMSSGVATTLHFMYPVLTAVLMMLYYNESRRPASIMAVIMAVGGVAVLSWPTEGSQVAFRGVVLELISAACFALYLIRVNRSRVANMEGLKLTFYIVFFGALIFGAEAFRQESFQLITTPTQAADLVLLGLLCTVVTNLSLVISVKNIGSTMTAVLGSMEPLTAVIMGAVFFGEAITWNIILGFFLIIPAVVIVILTRNR